MDSPLDRPGPEPLDDDSWDTGQIWPKSAASVDDSVRYHGRRRTTGSWSRGRWAIGAAAVTIAFVAIGTLIMMPDPRAGDGGSTGAPGDLTNTTGATSGSTTGDLPIGGGSAPVGQPTATPLTSSGVPPFEAVTVEAESPSVTLSGSAAVTADNRASGGQIVTGVGTHATGGAPGVVQIAGLLLPSAGTYRITIYYANAEGSNHTAAQVAVSGAEPITVNFPGNPKCCGVRSVDVTVPAGQHTLTITNGSGMAPSIDKVVISRA